MYHYTKLVLISIALLAIVWASLAFCMLSNRTSKCCTTCYAICGALLTLLCTGLAIPLVTIDESTTPIIEAVCNEKYDSLPNPASKILTELKEEGYTLRKIDNLLDSRYNILCRGICPCAPVDMNKWPFLQARRMHRNFDFQGDIQNMMECVDRLDMVGDVIGAIAGEPCIKPYCG